MTNIHCDQIVIKEKKVNLKQKSKYTHLYLEIKECTLITFDKECTLITFYKMYSCVLHPTLNQNASPCIR